MDLRQVVYSSRPVSALSLTEVDQIVAASQRYNGARGITGRLLVVTDGADRVQAFMQWIEGPALSVQTCLKRIVADPRHTSIHVVQNEPVEARSYPEWSMRQEVLPEDDVERVLAVTGLTGRVDADGSIRMTADDPTVLDVDGEVLGED